MKLKSLTILLMIFYYGFTGNAQQAKTKLENPETEKKIDSLLLSMTLKEKIGQLVLYNGSWDVTGPPGDKGSQEKLDKIKKGEVGAMLNVISVRGALNMQKAAIENSRLKIPLLFGYDVIHGFKTIFPIPLAEASSWDMEAVQRSSSIAAKEATASGINWAFAPMLDVSRDPRWGRIMEGGGEDPFLVSQIAAARIQGFQGDDLSKNNTLAACAKHLAAYGFAEGGRDYNTVTIGDNDLHNIVLPPFKTAVENGVASVMSAFNEVNGIPATANYKLLRETLKNKWDFKGFVVSDWASITEMIMHGYVKDKKEASFSAIKAGTDMDMEGNAYENNLEQLINEKQVDEALLNDAVKRILRIKFRLGLFDDPYLYCDESREKKDIYTKEHLDTAQDIAAKSIVLLQNNNNLLPISPDIKKIAVIGPLANDKDAPIGSWRGNATPGSAVSVLEGIEARVTKDVNISYAKGVSLGVGDRSFVRELKVNHTDFSGIEEAVDIAKKNELVILVIGEEAFQAGEGRSQTDITLTAPQQKLLEEVSKANNNVVVVLLNGRPMVLTNVIDRASSVVEAWHLGSASGSAIASVLFGDYNPSGKLPVSFPRSVGQIPVYYNHKNTGRPSNPDGMVFWSHYTDQENTPLFPFGYGLSYTSFSYSDLKLSQNTFSDGERITATVNIKNTGRVKGKEIIQWYIRDLVGSYTRPLKELKGFNSIELAPGEQKTVSFTIDASTLAFYTANNKWETEPGDFEVYVGSDSTTKMKRSFIFK